jgi:hypothetical protein
LTANDDFAAQNDFTKFINLTDSCRTARDKRDVGMTPQLIDGIRHAVEHGLTFTDIKEARKEAATPSRKQPPKSNELIDIMNLFYECRDKLEAMPDDALLTDIEKSIKGGMSWRDAVESMKKVFCP